MAIPANLRVSPADLAREMRQQDKKRYTDPAKRYEDHDIIKTLQRVYVVYVWRDWAIRWYTPTGHSDTRKQRRVELGEHQWVLAGFVRRRTRRKLSTMNKRFAAIRRKLEIFKDETVRVVDLWTDWQNAKRGVTFPAPDRRITSTVEPPTAALAIVRAPKQKKPTKMVANRSVDPKTAKYVVFGVSRVWKNGRITYLGALAATTKRSAEKEGKSVFNLHDTTVVAVDDLLPKFRRRVRNWKLVPGITHVKQINDVLKPEAQLVPVASLKGAV